MRAPVSSSASLFPLILAALLAGASFWLEVASRPPVGATDGKTRHDPDYYVDNFAVRRYDTNGLLQHTLVAQRMQHYPDNDTTEIDGPRITYHRAPPTLITAQTARLDSEGTHVELIGDVRLQRTGVSGKPDTLLTTRQLNIFPDDEVATTRHPVSLVQGLSTLQGLQMEIDNKTSLFVLDGQVRGVFFRNGQARVQPIAAASVTGTPRAEAVARPQTKAKPNPVRKRMPKSKPLSRPKTQR